jgi:hypothetical protein
MLMGALCAARDFMPPTPTCMASVIIMQRASVDEHSNAQHDPATHPWQLRLGAGHVPFTIMLFLEEPCRRKPILAERACQEVRCYLQVGPMAGVDC